MEATSTVFVPEGVAEQLRRKFGAEISSVNFMKVLVFDRATINEKR